MMPVRIHFTPFDSLFLVFGGPHGELGAATRYLNQRYTMPLGKVQGMLTDIGIEGS
jgi:spore coat protein JC